jgi:hypothetical protein
VTAGRYATGPPPASSLTVTRERKSARFTEEKRRRDVEAGWGKQFATCTSESGERTQWSTTAGGCFMPAG